jgi:molybdate transport system regulatory protein
MPARTRTRATPAPAARPAARRRAPAVAPKASFRLRITAGELVAIGPGKIALLESIARTGSLTAAAKLLDMSYRRAWVLLDEVNRSLREPAVASSKGGSRGGGSELTEPGRRLISLYRHIESTALQTCAGELREMFALLATGA